MKLTILRDSSTSLSIDRVEKDGTQIAILSLNVPCLDAEEDWGDSKYRERIDRIQANLQSVLVDLGYAP